MSDLLNFIIRDVSERREELKAKRLKMENFMGRQILERFKGKTKYNEAIQIVEYSKYCFKCFKFCCFFRAFFPKVIIK